MHDLNFITALEIFEDLPEFDYWVSYGSLLGLVREGELIEWDNDIDICIVKGSKSHELMYTVRENFEYEGFSVCTSDNNYQFHRTGGRKIDINILTPIFEGSNLYYDLVWEIYFIQERLEKRVVSKVLKSVDKFLPRRLRNIWRGFSAKLGYFGMLGYRTNSAWVEEKFDLKYGTQSVRLPIGYEVLLENIYGPDWKIPKRSTVWYQFGRKR